MTVMTHNNTKGLVRAFDVKSGKLLWTFNTIPRPGELGNDTWENESWAQNGNTGVWTQITVDEERGLVYLPVETPTSDFYGGHRPGNNLFAESLVCVDLKTGQRKWHFQFIHHGIWDHDNSSARDAHRRREGRQSDPRRRVAEQAGLRLPVQPRDRPADLSDRRDAGAGERRARREGGADAADSDGRARQAVELRARVSRRAGRGHRLHAGAARRSAREPETLPCTRTRRTCRSILGDVNGLLGTLNHGNTGGGTNWPGGGLDPETHIFYSQANTAGVTTGSLREPPPEFKTDINYVSGVKGREFRDRRRTGLRQRGGRAAARRRRGWRRGAEGAPAATPAAPAGGAAAPAAAARRRARWRRRTGPQGLPLVKPPYGVMAAVNLDKGEIMWRVPHGDTPDTVRNHPALKGLTIPKTGQNGSVGVLVTKTLVIAAIRR